MNNRPVRQNPRWVAIRRQLHHTTSTVRNGVFEKFVFVFPQQPLPIPRLRNPSLLRQIVTVPERLRSLACVRVNHVPAEPAQRCAFLWRKPGGGALPQRGLLLTRCLTARILERLIASLDGVV